MTEEDLSISNFLHKMVEVSENPIPEAIFYHVDALIKMHAMKKLQLLQYVYNTCEGNKEEETKLLDQLTTIDKSINKGIQRLIEIREKTEDKE